MLGLVPAQALNFIPPGGTPPTNITIKVSKSMKSPLTWSTFSSWSMANRRVSCATSSANVLFNVSHAFWNSLNIVVSGPELTPQHVSNAAPKTISLMWCRHARCKHSFLIFFSRRVEAPLWIPVLLEVVSKLKHEISLKRFHSFNAFVISSHIFLPVHGGLIPGTAINCCTSTPVTKTANRSTLLRPFSAGTILPSQCSVSGELHLIFWRILSPTSIRFRTRARWMVAGEMALRSTVATSFAIFIAFAITNAASRLLTLLRSNAESASEFS